MLTALTREVSPAIGHCELTHLARQPIDVSLAHVQHHAYEVCLQALDCMLIRLPAEPELPDSVFVEDTAVVLDEVAIITRPGADSRKAETASVAQALAPFRRLVHIQPPGTLDGGDVLRVGGTLYVGLSTRSNQHAIEQMQVALSEWGYHVISVEVDGCLHLKSAITQIAENTLLINRRWVDARVFEPARLIDIDEREPYGANALWVGESLIYPTSYPETQKRLAAHGLKVKPVDMSELIKAEGAVTCCSLVFRADG